MHALKLLFLFDGSIFSIVGLIVLFFPAAGATALPPEAGDTPHMRDTRRLLASAYFAVGLLLLACGAGRCGEPFMRLAAMLRAVSLVALVGVNVSQLRSNHWKPRSLAPFLVAFPLMAILYATLSRME